MKRITNARGTTLTEMLLIVGLVLSLIGLSSINLTSSLDKASINSTASIVIADMLQQRIKAMVGDTEGRGTIDSYGIKFENNRYIAFHGTTYPIGDPDNFIINLDTNLEFSSVTFPNSEIIFSKGSGEILGFTPGSNSVVVRNKNDGSTKTIVLNKYGVITGIN